jgi:HSF-type DNA-binding
MKGGKGSQHKAARRESKTRTSADSEDESTSLEVDQDGIARGGVATPFPWKLHEMLEDSAKEGNEWIVSWQSHGRSFLVHKPRLFVEKIMPTYFNQSKFASFQRQLNLYGFSRLTAGKDKGAYYHSCFVRGHRGLCRGMVRQKIKGTKVRRTLAPEEEPDFYKMTATPEPASPPMPPLKVLEEAPVEAASKTTPRRRKSSTCSRASCNMTTNVISAKESALKLRQDRLHVVRDALKQTEMFRVGDLDRGHHPGAVHHEGGAPKSVSPMDSEDPESEEDSAAVVSPPRGQQQQRVSSWPPSMIDSKVERFSPRLHEMAMAHIKGGDLLFFEGKPFHYLEHLDSLPSAAPPIDVKSTTPATKSSYSFTATRDSLQSLMRMDSHVIMGAAFKMSLIP